MMHRHMSEPDCFLCGGTGKVLLRGKVTTCPRCVDERDEEDGAECDTAGVDYREMLEKGRIGK